MYRAVSLLVKMYFIHNILNLLLVKLIYFRLTEFQIWLSTLPNLLCQSEISEKTVDMMSLLARQKNTLFINSLKTKFPEILSKYMSYIYKYMKYYYNISYRQPDKTKYY